MAGPRNLMSSENETLSEYSTQSSVQPRSEQLNYIGFASAQTPSASNVGAVYNNPATNMGPSWNEYNDNWLWTLYVKQGISIDVIAATYFPGFSGRELLAIFTFAHDRLMTRTQGTATRPIHRQPPPTQQPWTTHGNGQHSSSSDGNMFNNNHTQQHTYTPIQQYAQPLTQQQQQQQQHQQPIQSFIQWHTHSPIWQQELSTTDRTPNHTPTPTPTPNHITRQPSPHPNPPSPTPPSPTPPPLPPQPDVRQLYLQQLHAYQQNPQQSHVQQPDTQPPSTRQRQRQPHSQRPNTPLPYDQQSYAQRLNTFPPLQVPSPPLYVPNFGFEALEDMYGDVVGMRWGVGRR